MVYTMTFLLVLPTLVGSLTGYKSNVEPFVLTLQGNYAPFMSFDYLSYVIHDGERVGLQKDYVVLANGLREGKHNEPSSHLAALEG